MFRAGRVVSGQKFAASPVCRRQRNVRAPKASRRAGAAVKHEAYGVRRGAGRRSCRVGPPARTSRRASGLVSAYAGAMADNDHDFAASRREITDALIAALDRRHEVLDVIVDADHRGAAVEAVAYCSAPRSWAPKQWWGCRCIG